jgi:hypothetical protein
MRRLENSRSTALGNAVNGPGSVNGDGNGGAEHRAGLKARPYKPYCEVQLQGQHLIEGCYYLLNGLAARPAWPISAWRGDRSIGRGQWCLRGWMARIPSHILDWAAYRAALPGHTGDLR